MRKLFFRRFSSALQLLYAFPRFPSRTIATPQKPQRDEASTSRRLEGIMSVHNAKMIQLNEAVEKELVAKRNYLRAPRSKSNKNNSKKLKNASSALTAQTPIQKVRKTPQRLRVHERPVTPLAPSEKPSWLSKTSPPSSKEPPTPTGQNTKISDQLMYVYRTLFAVLLIIFSRVRALSRTATGLRVCAFFSRLV